MKETFLEDKDTYKLCSFNVMTITLLIQKFKNANSN